MMSYGFLIYNVASLHMQVFIIRDPFKSTLELLSESIKISFLVASTFASPRVPVEFTWIHSLPSLPCPHLKSHLCHFAPKDHSKLPNLSLFRNWSYSEMHQKQGHRDYILRE